MHWLLVSYTTWFNWRYRRSGQLFQGRYKSLLAEEGEYLLTLARYVHLNPVRGKRLGEGSPGEQRKRLRAYEWSSYAGTAGLARTYSFVQPEMILEELGGPVRGRGVRYRRFVEEGLVQKIASPWEAARLQAVLGSESFVRRLKDRLSDRRKERDLKGTPAMGRKPLPPEEVLRAVAKRYQVPVARLQGEASYGLEARNVALWLIWQRCGLSQGKIGEIFGGLKSGAVGRRLRRIPPRSRATAEGISVKSF